MATAVTAKAATPEKEIPVFEIAERRAQNGDIDALREIDASAALINQTVPMTTRWIFTGPGAPLGRFHRVIAQLGYKQVHKTEIATSAAMNGWGTSPEGFITRGERGQEILVKMPEHLYKAIQLRKAQDGDARRRSAGRLKQTVQEELGAEGNHRAAEAMGRMTMPEFQESADFRKP